METVLLSVFSSAVYSLLSKSGKAIYEDFKFIISNDKNTECLSDEEVSKAFEIIEEQNFNDEMSENLIKRRLENSEKFSSFIKELKIDNGVLKNTYINQSNIFGDNNVSL